MLHETIFSLFHFGADNASGSGGSSNPIVAIVSASIAGVVSITASVCGVLSIRHNKAVEKQKSDNPAPPAPPEPGSDKEPPWVRHLRHELREAEEERDRYMGYLIDARIDPRTGKPMTPQTTEGTA